MTKTLLVVDDALIIREIVKETAIGVGWEIAGEATNGQEAIDQYLQLKPSAVTLDMVMPEYDGLHALRGIISADADAKILVLSALDQKAVLQEAFKLGASDFIVKPFDKGHLVESLECMVADTVA